MIAHRLLFIRTMILLYLTFFLQVCSDNDQSTFPLLGDHIKMIWALTDGQRRSCYLTLKPSYLCTQKDKTG